VRNFLLWRLTPLVIIVTGFLGRSPWIEVAWTTSFAVMGAACLLNAHRCGRVHCHFTGPLYLLASAASLLQGLGIISVGWIWIGGVALAGGIFLNYVPEWIWGKYVSRRA
jgi:hypothetical protein